LYNHDLIVHQSSYKENAMSIDQFARAYQSNDDHQRLAAIRSLEQLRAVEAVPILLQARNDTCFDVRVHAVIGLALLGDVRAVGPLLLLVHDTRLNPDLLPAVWEALAHTRDPRATEALVDVLQITTARTLRYQLVRFIGITQDPRIFDILCEWLKSPDAQFAAAAAHGLAHYGDIHAIDHLLNYVRDPDDRVRQAVQAAIRELQGR
jgi:HEAT repeat protein